jgi:hypothetical protein
MNLITDKTTVQFGARLAELDAAWGGFTVEALDASDIFVNGNYCNYKGSRKKFEQTIAFDTVNDDAEPVLLYLQGDVMVGYYDDEMKQGFTA